MPATYIPIFSYTVSGSSTTYIDFTSIPSTYTTLKIVQHVGNNTGNFYWTTMQVGNGSIDTGSNYYSTVNTANQLGNYYSSRYNASDVWRIGGSSNQNKSTNVAYIFNYASTSYWKSGLFTMGFAYGSAGWSGEGVTTWKNTAAINTIRFALEGGSVFTDGSVITVYGIKAA